MIEFQLVDLIKSKKKEKKLNSFLFMKFKFEK